MEQTASHKYLYHYSRAFFSGNGANASELVRCAHISSLVPTVRYTHTISVPRLVVFNQLRVYPNVFRLQGQNLQCSVTIVCPFIHWKQVMQSTEGLEGGGGSYVVLV